MNSHNAAPQPEQDHQRIRDSIGWEIVIANRLIGSMLGVEPIPHLSSWDMDNPNEERLADGFRRAQTILQGISYGRPDWEQGYWLDIHFGTAESSTANDTTKGLLQLVVLSRTPVRHINDRWRLPTRLDVLTTKLELQKELGLPASADTADFSGTNYDTLVDAITTGQVAVGHPGQPDVQCWWPQDTE